MNTYWVHFDELLLRMVMTFYFNHPVVHFFKSLICTEKAGMLPVFPPTVTVPDLPEQCTQLIKFDGERPHSPTTELGVYSPVIVGR